MKITVNIPIILEFSEAQIAPHYYDMAEHWVEDLVERSLMQQHLGAHLGMTLGEIRAERTIQPAPDLKAA